MILETATNLGPGRASLPAHSNYVPEEAKSQTIGGLGERRHVCMVRLTKAANW
jgi:hypothetical protein